MISHQKINIICITGPTASGKTKFAAHLAYELDGEVISADSRQVYRMMDIGTGKDKEDYIVKGVRIPSHLTDIADPGTEYNVFLYQRDFLNAFHDIRKRERLPILCGGTGLYIEAVLKGYRLIHVPVNEDLRMELNFKSMKELEERLRSYRNLHNKTDIVTRKRLTRAIEIEEYYRSSDNGINTYPEIKPLLIGILFDRETRRKRITERLTFRLRNGLPEEVKALLESGILPDKLIYYGLEYKYLTLYLTGKMSYDEMFIKLNTAIHQFSKRQMTWFRKMEREGIKIHWIEGMLSMDEKIRISKEIIGSYE